MLESDTWVAKFEAQDFLKTENPELVLASLILIFKILLKINISNIKLELKIFIKNFIEDCHPQMTSKFLHLARGENLFSFFNESFANDLDEKVLKKWKTITSSISASHQEPDSDEGMIDDEFFDQTICTPPSIATPSSHLSKSGTHKSSKNWTKLNSLSSEKEEMVSKEEYKHKIKLTFQQILQKIERNDLLLLNDFVLQEIKYNSLEFEDIGNYIAGVKLVNNENFKMAKVKFEGLKNKLSSSLNPSNNKFMIHLGYYRLDLY